jgi:hypothetical protein
MRPFGREPLRRKRLLAEMEELLYEREREREREMRGLTPTLWSPMAKGRR